MYKIEFSTIVDAREALEVLKMSSGLPTRAEITDATMGQRAECVMLNKGHSYP